MIVGASPCGRRVWFWPSCGDGGGDLGGVLCQWCENAARDEVVLTIFSLEIGKIDTRTLRMSVVRLRRRTRCSSRKRLE